VECNGDKTTTGPRDGLPRRKDAFASSIAVEMSGYNGGDIADMLLTIDNIINILRRSPCSLVCTVIFFFTARVAPSNCLSPSSPLSPLYNRSASSHASPTARGPHSFCKLSSNSNICDFYRQPVIFTYSPRNTVEGFCRV